ncbi:helix-turn-helix domain-containing protein [Paenibacillus sp. 5J-6]|uniref:Helix-turn-helix domain-containing protein n=1 Tax=Paenibacillus silvestris TaxID=2606219 RepID=A0A6L8UW54_9BACL|nr:AraC family transcriptional regulator [Paenibacillus silvestris]MZQ82127.1 helix-turn-helix domain-containing protein [Paenibacillus silvestris]
MPQDHVLPLLITSHGSMTLTDHYPVLHHPSDYFMIYCKKGAGRIGSQDHEFMLHEGMIYISPPQITSTYNMISEPWDFIYLTFNGSLLHRFLFALQLVDANVYPLDDMQQMIIHEIVLFQKSHHKDRDYHGSGLLYMLLIKLKFSQDHSLHEDQKENKLMFSSIISFIKQNYQHDISLTMLANQMSITEQHFNRMFKKEYQMTPITYLTRYRLLKAKELLIRDDQMTVKDISEAVGFNSPSYFGAVFKKYVGCSPIELRKKNES